MIESILKIVTSNEQIWVNKEKDTNEFQLNNIKEILYLALQIDMNLGLNSEEILSFQILIEIDN